MKKIFLLFIIFCLFFSNSSLGTEELVSNSLFDKSASGWLKYSNFVNGDEIRDWSVWFEEGKGIILGSDCQPQSRIGFRSREIALPNPGSRENPQIFRLCVEWEGLDIHRCGIYFILQDNWQKIFRYGEILGPAGNFARAETAYFQVPQKDFIHKPFLLLYMFHDGIGKLVVKKISVTRIEPEQHGDILSLETAPNRKRLPLKKQLVVKEPKESLLRRLPFGTLKSAGAPLLPGEIRFLSVCSDNFSTQGMKILGRYKIAFRNVAQFWDYGVAKSVPFFLEPVKKGEKADVIKATGISKNLPPLPPLPENYHAYLYYYGDYRYGKSNQDFIHDHAEMKFICKSGFTGLCLQDNYEMDFGEWLKNKKTTNIHLVKMTKPYMDAGFSSPLVFGLLGGLDKGRVTWKGSIPDMKSYLSEIQPHFVMARKILGHTGLWIAPVDEPNQEPRTKYAKALLPLWKETFNVPLMITCNWKTAGKLGNADKIWVGAGDYPSFEVARKRGICGFYAGLDSGEHPLRFRRMSGVHAWASGLSSQAYWNFCDVQGSADSGLDGKQGDFLCVLPESDPSNPAISLHFAALHEGLMDLRLLFAMEKLWNEKHDQLGKAPGFYISHLKDRILPTDRITKDWDEPKDFDEFRNQGVTLWINAHNN